MRIAASYRNLERVLQARSASFKKLPAFLSAKGFQALEISDRDLITLSSENIEDLVAGCRKLDVALIIDINVDLTLRHLIARRKEIDHALAQLTLIHGMDASLCRISLGGQAVSLQKLLKSKLRTSAPVPKKSNHGKTRAFPGRLAIQSMGYFAHRLRKGMPAISWQTAPKIGRAIESLRDIAQTAEELNITIGIENHWGISSRPEWILKMIHGVGSPALGTCPDFGNWPRGVSPDEGVAQLAPHAVIAHVKSLNSRKDAADQRTSIARKIDTLRYHGFSGPLTIEHEAAGDAWQQIRETQRMISKLLSKR